MGIEGIIRPPPEIRAVADKTATFIAKNGRDFETRILNSAKGKTPKFAFLHASSPFNAYYEDRIVFYANGGAAKEKEAEKKGEGDEEKDTKDDVNENKVEQQDGDGKSEEDGESKQKDQKLQTGVDQKMAVDESTKMMRKAKSIVDPVAKALLAQRAKIKEMSEQTSSNDKAKQEEKEKDVNSDDNANDKKHITPSIPPRQIYTTSLPPKAVSPSQLEIIKVTAQFVALNGGNKNNNVFLRQLTIQEWQNPIYGFLQPRHGHYAYFTQLVDIFRRILQRTVLLHEQSIAEEKKDDHREDSSASDTSLFTMANLKRFVGLGSSEQIESTGLQLKEEIQSVQNMAGSVHACLDYAAYQAEYDRYNAEKKQAKLEKMMDKGGGGFLGGSSRVDWHDFVVVETIDFAVDEVVESLPPPPPPLPKVEVVAKPIPVENDDMEGSSDDDDDDKEGIQVVPDYTPKVVSSQAKFASEARTHVIDPITKRSIAIADMSEHMRIQLLDPKWAAEKERFMEKQKDSNLVRGDVIALNVNAFTKARGDLFASSASEQMIQEANLKRRQDEANKLIQEQSVALEPKSLPITGQSHLPLSSTHERPEIESPNAKRVRVGEFSVGQTNSLQMPPPTVQGTLQQEQQQPSSLPPSDKKDTEVIQTRLPELEFAKSLPNPMVTLSITVPNDNMYASWNFRGQTITISIDVMTKIKGLKQKIQPQLGDMPLNKIQLRSREVGFLKDASSLAKLNICSSSTPIELIPKIRGSRK